MVERRLQCGDGKRKGRQVTKEVLARPSNTQLSSSSPSIPATNTSSSKAARQQAGKGEEKRRGKKKEKDQGQSLKAADVPLDNRYGALSEDEQLPGGERTEEKLLNASSGRDSRGTIVASGELDGVRCDDMLIDTGASCNFVRRSWAQAVKLSATPLKEPVTVTLADRRTVTATHEVRAKKMAVHGSTAAGRLLVMDDLSNEVIVGLDWQRKAAMTIQLGHPHDLLNGKPLVRSKGRPAAPPRTIVGSMDERLATADERLQKILKKYAHVLAVELPKRTEAQRAEAKQFRIEYNTAVVKPVKQAERRHSPAEIAAATKWVQDEVAAGRMEPANGEWASQLVIVGKKNEKGEPSGWRICGDYRDVNAATKSDAEPLPLMQTVFDQLNGMKWFSKLDLTSGFNQIPVEKGSRECLAVSTPLGLYQPTVMPFGVKNAPGTFQREMRRVFKDRLNKGVQVFVDDVILASKTDDEHPELVDWALGRLDAENYYANPKKLKFMQNEIDFLGHVVSGKGVSVQAHKVKDIRDWPELRNVKEVRQFLGLAGYYRRFVPGFAHVAEPLTALTQTKTGLGWYWRHEQRQAFRALKKAMTEAPVLAHPDPQRQWIVYTDASQFAVGAVLSQKQEDGTVRPVAYWSHKLQSAQRNYSATERELMAIVLATKHWRAYLHGSPFPVLLKSDHQPLIYLNGKQQLGSRLTRWMEQLTDLTFEMGYVKGKDNGAADALSRRSDHEVKDDEAVEPQMAKVRLMAVVAAQTFPALWSRWSTAAADWMNGPTESVAAAQTAAGPTVPAAAESKQSEYQLHVESLLGDLRVAAKADEKYQLLLAGEEKHDGLQRRDGLVYSRRGAVYVPDDRPLKTRLLMLAHDAAGHFGRTKTIERLGRHCVWTGLTREVEDYCRSCAVCAANKSVNALPAGLLRPLPIPDGVWDSVGVDFVGPLPMSKEGHDYIMVLIDRLSKMLQLRACNSNINAIQSGRLLLEMMLPMGKLPTSIVSDRDVRFTSAAWGQLWKGLDCKLKMSTAYHPQTDGQTERVNRTIQTTLRAYAEKREDWEQWLPFVAAAYNSQQQESTKRTPFEMNFPDRRAIDPLQWAIRQGQPAADDFSVGEGDPRGVSVEAKRTLDEMKVIWDEVRAQLMMEQSRQKKHADQRRREVTYEVGDSVYLSTQNLKALQGKLTDKWIGPYLVQEVRPGGTAVRLDLRGTLGKTHPVFHVKLLRPYDVAMFEWPGRETHNRPAPQLVDGDTEWEVECVIGKQVTMETGKVEKVEERPASRRAGMRPQPPRVRTVTEEVPVVWYKVKWKGWDDSDATWKKAEELTNSREAVDEYELRLRQMDEKESASSASTAVVELGVATAVQWWMTDRQRTRRSGSPTVRCSYMSAAAVRPAVCETAVSCPAQPAANEAAAVRPAASEAAVRVPAVCVPVQPVVSATAVQAPAVCAAAQASTVSSAVVSGPSLCGVAGSAGDPCVCGWCVACSRRGGRAWADVVVRGIKANSLKNSKTIPQSQPSKRKI
jgi:hypothetical protein